MPWFKVDDSFYDHPKVFDLPDSAVALWVRAGTWSARNLTNGFVPTKLPARLCDDHVSAVRALCTSGLWKKTSNGYQFHDWHVYQPTADAVRDLKAKRAEAGRKGGQAKAHKQTASKPLASAKAVAKQNPAPARTRPEGSGHLERESLGGATRAHAREGPPSPHCPQHPDGTNEPCGACADARRERERFDAGTDELRRQARAELDIALADPAQRCEHGTDAGLWINPDTDLPRCALCRQRARSTARRTA